ncbi:MAG: hypothetical protein ACLRFI_02440 [Alphaproteobacteria bacterium]
MQNKNKFLVMLVSCFLFVLCFQTNYAVADAEMYDESVQDIIDDNSFQEFEDEEFDEMSANAVDAYDVDGSVFQQITILEQEKVLMQLEKERAQLDLELDKLAAEKIKLQMEIDALSGRAEHEQMQLENEKAKLEAETQKLEKEKERLQNSSFEEEIAPVKTEKKPQQTSDISSKYKLVNIIGAGDQLQASLSDLKTGQTKKITVGKELDGFLIKSISLDDGVTFVKDGEEQTLNISGR